jgi:hypothetical protein
VRRFKVPVRFISTSAIPLTYQARTGHLPLLMSDLICRLRLSPGAQSPISRVAREQGILRRKKGYTLPIVVEESRISQVSVFNTLQNNSGSVEFGTVLLDFMTIAGEVDSELKQAMLGFSETAVAKSAGWPRTVNFQPRTSPAPFVLRKRCSSRVGQR